MKKGFMHRLYSIIDNSDLVIEVVDARFPEKTRNKRIEKTVKAKGKELLIVLNKSDLVSKNTSKKVKKEIVKEFSCVFVSSAQKTGFSKLREMIAIKLKQGNIVGVIGYPNTGKSSVINILSGKKIRTSITAGYTRGEQIINAGKFKLIDSPGVIPIEEWNEEELVLIGAKNPSRLKYPEDTAIKLIELLKEKNPKELEKLGVKNLNAEAEEILEEIALKRKRLRKKGLPDTDSVSKQLLLEWQKGKIRV